MKKMLRLLVFVLVPFIAVLAVGGNIFNYVSRHRWESKKQELLAKGINIDPEFILERRIPRELNAYEAPITAAVLTEDSSSSNLSSANALIRLRGDIKPRAKFNLRTDEPATFKVEQEPEDYPKSGTDQEKLVEWSKKFDEPISEWLHEFEKYPQFQFQPLETPKSLAEMNIQFAQHGIRFEQSLHALALANLQAGNVEAAYKETLLMLKLSQSFLNQRILISDMVGQATFRISLNPRYLGIKNGQWTNAQLEGFEQQLSQIDILRSTRDAFAGELSYFCQSLDRLASGEFTLSALTNPGVDSAKKTDLFVDLAFRMVPRGFCDLAKRTGVDFLEAHYLASFDLKNRKLEVSKVNEKQMASDLEQLPWGTNMLLKLMISSLTPAIFKAYNIDMDIKLTRIAIALERYKLKYQKYPDDLSALSPEFLPGIPVDWAHQKAPSYEQTPAGRYRIWHPGWDGNDEGGVPAEKPDQTKGDLVWTFESVNPKK